MFVLTILAAFFFPNVIFTNHVTCYMCVLIAFVRLFYGCKEYMHDIIHDNFHLFIK